jgi:hypothetical protein
MASAQENRSEKRSNRSEQEMLLFVLTLAAARNCQLHQPFRLVCLSVCPYHSLTIRARPVCLSVDNSLTIGRVSVRRSFANHSAACLSVDSPLFTFLLAPPPSRQRCKPPTTTLAHDHGPWTELLRIRSVPIDRCR